MNKIPEFKDENEEREFWDSHSFLDFPGDVEEIESFSLSSELKDEILLGKRRRRMINLSLRFDPFHIALIKRIARQKSISYQSLIRMWIAEKLKDESS
ncbi:hypothetical protein FJZ31_30350 [Candidatus Poribacteria bacterium]|nr:hypothetical protein [Candidatus Poribacteria bacterium]